MRLTDILEGYESTSREYEVYYAHKNTRVRRGHGIQFAQMCAIPGREGQLHRCGTGGDA